MSIELPQPRLPQKAVPRLVDFGAVLTPPAGGAAQRLNRLGNRYELDVAYPRLRPEPDGRVVASKVRLALSQGALFPFPQPGLDIGNPGAPVVNGAGQAGSSLSIRGLTAGYVVRDGQFFSIVHGGRRYLHAAAADATASGTGIAVVSIVPMLRISPANGAVCEFAKPYIEGLFTGNPAEIEQTIAKSIIPQLTIRETR